MPKVIRIDQLSQANIREAAKEVRRYAEWVERKEDELRVKLAQVGVDLASIRFSGAVYDGNNDVTVTVSHSGDTATISASGNAVAFIEFGSGLIGYGHPLSGPFGMGPGTWSEDDQGKGHWNNPNGWFYAHGKKSHGNPPAMAMYSAVQAMTEQLTEIAREVFGGA